MNPIRLGDTVEWQPNDQPLTRGRVLDVAGDMAHVEYGPWGDRAWLATESLRVVVVPG